MLMSLYFARAGEFGRTFVPALRLVPFRCALLPVLALCGLTQLGCQSTGNSFQAAFQRNSSVTSSSPGTSDIAVGKELRNPSRVHLAYARWQEQMGKQADARASYHRALEHDPKSLDARIGLARLEAVSGQYAAAEEHLVIAAKQHKRNPQVQAGYADLYAIQKDWTRAESMLREAIAAAPNEQVFHHQLGVVLVRSGRVDAGVAEFELAVGDAEAYYNAAYLLAEMGQTSASQQYLEKSLALNPELKAATFLRNKLIEERVALAHGTRAPRDANVATPASYQQ